MAQTEVERVAELAFDVEFFEDNFTAFFHFGFVFTEFLVFNFEGAPGAAVFDFHFCFQFDAVQQTGFPARAPGV